MKASKIIIIALATAVVALCARLAASCGGDARTSDMERAVLRNIAERASVRAYEDKEVERDKIEKLLRAGMAAPSAVNRQPWHFIVVTDKDRLGLLSRACPNASMAAAAPLAIVVCGDMGKALDGPERDFWVQDASAAAENILLAAQAMGLGAVWTGTYPMRERCERVAKAMDLPEGMIPLCTLVIGYPAESPVPKDKYDEANVSYQSFGGKDPGNVAAPRSGATPDAGGVFGEFDVMDAFRENPFRFFNKDWLLLAAGDRQEGNAMTISWGGLGTLWGKSAVTVYVAQGRHTHGFMETSDYFTVMTFRDRDVLRYMGSHSGRDGDKAKALGLHTLHTENGTPYYGEADMVIECRVMYGRAFDPAGFRSDVPRDFYERRANAGIHSMYIGEVVKALRKQ